MYIEGFSAAVIPRLAGSPFAGSLSRDNSFSGYASYAGDKKKKKKKKDKGGDDKAKVAKYKYAAQVAIANQNRSIAAQRIPITDIQESAYTDRTDIRESGLTDRTDIGESNLTQRTDITTGGAVDIEDIRTGGKVDLESIKADRDVALQGDKGELMSLQYDDADAQRQFQLDRLEQQQQYEQDKRDFEFEREQYLKELERADREELMDRNTDIESNAYEGYSEEPFSAFDAIMPLIDGSFSGTIDPFSSAGRVPVRPRPLWLSGTTAQPVKVGMVTYDAQGRPVKTMYGRNLTKAQLQQIRVDQMRARAVAQRNQQLRRRAMTTPLGLNPASAGFAAALANSGAVTDMGSLGGQRVARKACCGSCENGGRCDSEHRQMPQVIAELVKSQQVGMQRGSRRNRRQTCQFGKCYVPSTEPAPILPFDGVFRGKCASGDCGEGRIRLLVMDGMRRLPPLRGARALRNMKGRCNAGACTADQANFLRNRRGGRCSGRVIRDLGNVVKHHADPSPGQAFIYRVVRRVSPLLGV